MKKILRSFFVIAATTAVAVGVSRAAFSDTEVLGDNTFETGTIDIAVNGENPWTETQGFKLDDLKPSFTDYIEFEVENVGNNPANVWKTLNNYSFKDVKQSEPECAAEEGIWHNDTKTCESPSNENNNLASVINYDMRVELYDTNNNKIWWETIYQDSDNVTLASLQGKQMYLGMIPAGWKMKVIQSYHMSDGGNRLQGDQMNFDITLYAEELTNKVTLVKKYEANSDVSHHLWNEGSAVFGYKVMDDQLRWTLDTKDVPDQEYTLIVWDDTTNDYVWNWSTRSDAKVLAHFTDNGDQTHSGEVNIGNLTNAKVWLVPGNFGGANAGDSAGNFPWEPDGTYFETGLVDYYDSL